MHPNNFNLIRLFAALQVVYCHTTFHLGITSGIGHPIISSMINTIPGVPVFFAVSGYLISRSWENSDSWSTYAQNRLLRIYPALWVAFAASVVVAWAFGFISLSLVFSGSFFAWTLAQVSCFQFYNPEFLRGFGVGAINGSLWTIPVELGFYFTLPVLYMGILSRTSRRFGDLVLGALATASFFYWHQLSQMNEMGNSFVKLQMITPLPHLHMFLFGVLLQRNSTALKPYIEGRFLFWLGLLFASAIIKPAVHDATVADVLHILVSRLFLGLTAISAAFTGRAFSERLLRGNDLSYGIYLYHMLVLNAIYHLGLRHGQIYLLITIGVSAAIAMLSWRFIEVPVLALKKLAQSANRAAESPIQIVKAPQVSRAA